MHLRAPSRVSARANSQGTTSKYLNLAFKLSAERMSMLFPMRNKLLDPPHRSIVSSSAAVRKVSITFEISVHALRSLREAHLQPMLRTPAFRSAAWHSQTKPHRRSFSRGANTQA